MAQKVTIHLGNFVRNFVIKNFQNLVTLLMVSIANAYVTALHHQFFICKRIYLTRQPRDTVVVSLAPQSEGLGFSSTKDKYLSNELYINVTYVLVWNSSST